MPLFTTRGGACLLLSACLLLHSVPAFAQAGASFAPTGAAAFAMVVPGGDLGSKIPLELEPDPLFDEDFDEEFEELAGPEVYDPLESGNRVVFGLNRQIDRFFWAPVTSGYRFVVPAPARRSVGRAFANLNTPIYLVNNLLQVRFRDAAETLGAFLVNSTVGVGGLFDAGQWVGLASQPADFGQTLALAGVGNGPYRMIPSLGPSTLRDGAGAVVDRFFHPLTYLIGIAPQLMWGGGVGVSRRTEADAKLKALEESSLDFYSVLRSAYVQTRQHSIDELRDDDAEVLAAPEIPPEEIAANESQPAILTAP
ncbi:MAG: VacJ family lipoprotein [Deltaproteobacteria bacterium]|nr:VacJ family lipoprotein [Deltaproteobacteria bacterium]